MAEEPEDILRPPYPPLDMKPPRDLEEKLFMVMDVQEVPEHQLQRREWRREGAAGFYILLLRVAPEEEEDGELESNREETPVLQVCLRHTGANNYQNQNMPTFISHERQGPVQTRNTLTSNHCRNDEAQLERKE